jgi:hypothetical protein
MLMAHGRGELNAQLAGALDVKDAALLFAVWGRFAK